MRRSIFLLAAAALAACDADDSIDPQDRIVATGTYEYEGRWLHPGTMEWDTISGHLVLELVTPDSVHGHWQVTGFAADSTGGYWNENAYVMLASSTSGQVTVTNRLSRNGAPDHLRCSLSYREERGGSAQALTTSGTCDIAFAP